MAHVWVNYPVRCRVFISRPVDFAESVYLLKMGSERVEIKKKGQKTNDSSGVCL